LKDFNEQKVVDYASGGAYNIFILAGPEKNSIEKLYTHELADGKKSVGMVHVYKDVVDKWQMIPAEEYEDRKSELPDVSFAFKCPIHEFEK